MKVAILFLYVYKNESLFEAAQDDKVKYAALLFLSPLGKFLLFPIVVWVLLPATSLF